MVQALTVKQYYKESRRKEYSIFLNLGLVRDLIPAV